MNEEPTSGGARETGILAWCAVMGLLVAFGTASAYLGVAASMFSYPVIFLLDAMHERQR